MIAMLRSWWDRLRFRLTLAQQVRQLRLRQAELARELTDAQEKLLAEQTRYRMAHYLNENLAGEREKLRKQRDAARATLAEVDLARAALAHRLAAVEPDQTQLEPTGPVHVTCRQYAERGNASWVCAHCKPHLGIPVPVRTVSS